MHTPTDPPRNTGCFPPPRKKSRSMYGEHGAVLFVGEGGKTGRAMELESERESGDQAQTMVAGEGGAERAREREATKRKQWLRERRGPLSLTLSHMHTPLSFSPPHTHTPLSLRERWVCVAGGGVNTGGE